MESVLVIDRTQTPIVLEEVRELPTYERPIQQVQCMLRWSTGCLNKSCSAFRKIDGNYYCVRRGLP